MMKQRPPTFRINRDSPLAKGLVFAGLGGGASTSLYADASGYGNNGTLTNMEPASDWVWVPELGRWATNSATSSEYIAHTSRIGADASWSLVSIAGWIKPSNRIAGHYVVVQVSGNGPSLWIDDGPTLQFRSTGLFGRSHGPLAAFTNGKWSHVVFTYSKPSYNFFFDGVNVSSGTVVGDNSVQPYSADWKSCYAGASADFADVCMWHRALSASEIQQLADPSNVMLSGLIRPPVRRWWPAVSGGTPAAANIPAIMHHRRLMGAA
jgi:hypothetical protein